MEQLSSLDSAFLYVENAHAPMHIGSVQIYEGARSEFDFAFYRKLIAERLDTSPVFRRRAVRVPLNLGRPYWIEDPDFDLDAHLEHVSLPHPGGWRQLREVARHRFSIPLDPSRPLWSFTFVEGLDGIPELPPGSFALVAKVHHSVTDGMGSRDIFSALWDLSPDTRRARGTDDWRPEPKPGAIGLLSRTVLDTARQPTAILEGAAAALRSFSGMGRDLFLGHPGARPLLFQAPKTRFNQPIEVQRNFGGISLPLNGVKAIKNRVAGTTVNDVVLAICAGGLRGFLEDKGELPDKPLVAMVPISVREESDPATSNQVSAMLVQLATGEDEPLARLRLIRDNALESKAYTRAVGARVLTDSTRVLPFSLASAASKLYSGMRVARFHRPPFNMVITNVPGPRTPLYLGGAKLLNIFGMAPVVDGLGLIIVITSYGGHLTISVNASRNLLPDIDLLLGRLRAAYRELSRAVAGMPRVGRQGRKRAR